MSNYTSEEFIKAFAEYEPLRRRQTETVADGFVYIVEFQGLYKIGKAKDVDKRIRSFTNVILPYDFKLVFAFPCRHAQLTERAVHRYYKEYRGRGEWFAFSDDLLHDVKWTILFFADRWNRDEVIRYDAEIAAWEADDNYRPDFSFLGEGT